MVMTRIPAAALLCGAFAFSTHAHAAQVSATAEAQVNIVDSGGVQVVSPVDLTTATLPQSSGGATGNVELTAHAQTEEILSGTVPSNLTLVRDGASETVTADTMTTYGIAGRGVLLGGDIINGAAMSVNIGGSFSLASADHLVTSPSKDLLVVVVQYN